LFWWIAKNVFAKVDGSGMLKSMNSVLEIEQPLRQMPPQERWEVARWLLEDLQENAISPAEGKSSGDNGERTPPLPDYSARRRQAYRHDGILHL